MVKNEQNFQDGKITKYNFANDNYIIITTRKIKEKDFRCAIFWNFDTYQNRILMPTEKNTIENYQTLNKARLTETLNLYKTLKKHKSKSKNKELLISALICVIHDIKQEIEFQQKLF